MTAVRLVIFSLLIPCFVAGFVPWWICRNWEYREFGIFTIIALFFMIAGFGFYIWSAFSFLLEGKGTPAIWFTGKLKFLLGEEPQQMVSGGLYKISRNPMYVGIILFVTGEAFLFETLQLLFYSLLLMIFFNIVVIYIEEPHLKKKHGNSYFEYLQRTPRWFRLKREK